MRSIICLFSVLLLSGNLYAESKPCSSGTGKEGYKTGYQLQRDVIRFLWEENFNKDCRNIEKFISAVNISFEPGDYDGDYYLQCRDEGLASGLAKELEVIQTECSKRCIDSGSLAGQLAGKQYCAVVESSIGGPVAAKIKICDTFSTLGCRTALEGIVNSLENCRTKSEQDRNFRDFVVNKACKS